MCVVSDVFGLKIQEEKKSSLTRFYGGSSPCPSAVILIEDIEKGHTTPNLQTFVTDKEVITWKEVYTWTMNESQETFSTMFLVNPNPDPKLLYLIQNITKFDKLLKGSQVLVHIIMVCQEHAF